MNEQMWSLVTYDNALAVAESPALGQVYVFCADVHRVVDQEHPVQPTHRRAMTEDEFADAVRAEFPRIRQRQRQLLVRLERDYPPSP